MLVEPLPHLFPGGIQVVVQQGLGRDDETGRAEAALGGPGRDPGPLQGMEFVGGTDPLDGGDLISVLHPLHLVNARPHQLAVQDDVTGPALPRAAPHLGPREPQLPPEDVRQGRIAIHNQVSLHAVHEKSLLNHPSSPLSLSRRKRIAPALAPISATTPRGQPPQRGPPPIGTDDLPLLAKRGGHARFRAHPKRRHAAGEIPR
ncbi:MAG: hypothetical protein BWY88_01183 [Synergistetes bacterium ADurb.Bin520]|nr:MAG: hypothetical protein BWY88_01183 [Synergistetes bacterium ADurb.Bin520]